MEVDNDIASGDEQGNAAFDRGDGDGLGFRQVVSECGTVRPLPSGRKSDTERGGRLISARLLNSSLDRKSI
ncbi:hypothetical protein J3P71_29840 (plasmid) [Rhizobium leguminosarum]|uniref:hypothetical protein n=1 Tax=Rhizobium leguminosarum TaxID=384 RepID=UPI0014420B93|nr:hypothetical protein [Rhizobium leguminosarum]MBY5835719.1 hypothetical protein [Rhizobium leguminosarum]NKM82163.1 hypothetical protein [Rhizobium leguminosarum bv. viciae]QSZ11903.1 hypothetical protein J3P71_29840 [Rhizobium leguminosarum]